VVVMRREEEHRAGERMLRPEVVRQRRWARKAGPWGGVGRAGG